MVEQFQRLLRELGRVPWVIGGDWNWTPDALSDAWAHPAYRCQAPKEPTQQHGGILDWFIYAPHLSCQLSGAEAFSSTG